MVVTTAQRLKRQQRLNQRQQRLRRWKGHGPPAAAATSRMPRVRSIVLSIVLYMAMICPCCCWAFTAYRNQQRLQSSFTGGTTDTDITVTRRGTSSTLTARIRRGGRRKQVETMALRSFSSSYLDGLGSHRSQDDDDEGEVHDDDKRNDLPHLHDDHTGLNYSSEPRPSFINGSDGSVPSDLSTVTLCEHDDDDTAEEEEEEGDVDNHRAEPLPLSQEDRRRLDDVGYRRSKVIPIILLDALLPGQQLYFTSSDPKFEALLTYLSQLERDFQYHRGTGGTQMNDVKFVPEVGILGFDPMSPSFNDPIQVGVTSVLSTRPTHDTGSGGGRGGGGGRGIQWGLNANNERVIATSFKGRQVFQLVGTPWMDQSQSFWLAHVEIIDGRYEVLPPQHEAETQRLFVELPDLIQQWMTLVVDANIATPAALQRQIHRSQLDVDRTTINRTPAGALAKDHDVTAGTQEHKGAACTESKSTVTTVTRRPFMVNVTNGNRNGSGSILLPPTQRDRAMWVVAALLNPIQGCYKKSQSRGLVGQRVVCPQDLRPAMLMCQNDFDRLLLATTALRRSIDSIRRYKLEQRR